MGYATVRGHYHKGPKKSKKARRQSTPSKPSINVLVVGGGSKPTPHDDDRTVEVLSELLTRPTQTARPMPSNGDCGIVVVQSEGSGSRGGMGYIASLGGFGGFGGGVVGDAPMQTPKPTAPKPSAPKPSAPMSVELAEGETLVGFIIRKPNGEMVLKFSK